MIKGNSKEPQTLNIEQESFPVRISTLFCEFYLKLSRFQLIPRTQRPFPEKSKVPRDPREFLKVLIPKLEQVKKEQDQHEKFIKKINDVSLTVLS